MAQIAFLFLVWTTVVNAARIEPLYNPCIDPASNFSSQLWCDSTKPVDQRVLDMLSRMTIAEKIANLDTQAPGIPSLGLNAYNWWSEGTHGVSTAHANATGSTPAATNFAFPITTAASFNRSLWDATGSAISREARAFMNAGISCTFFGAMFSIFKFVPVSVLYLFDPCSQLKQATGTPRFGLQW